jgi:hypothetical protein
MRRNLWGNADSADNERKGLLATTEGEAQADRRTLGDLSRYQFWFVRLLSDIQASRLADRNLVWCLALLHHANQNRGFPFAVHR